ncbi:MAG: DNRLRE domain-containing protein, partial [Eubacteriales bacterium]|nr:DNRLRE domain-containing protein [Eubacteriales bacterium]
MKNEKRFLRTVALILFTVLAVQLPSFALPADFGEENGVLPQTEQENSEGTDAFGAEVKVIGEDEALRTEDTKHFILSDGTHIAAKYESAVHYEKDGAWEDIDNTLTLQDAVDANDINGFINTSSGIRYKFANSSKSAKLFRMKFGDHDISWGLKSQGVNNVSPVATNGSKPADLNEKESAMTLENVTSKVLYENIFDGIDLEYVIRGNDVKENIIIKQTQSAYSYTFEIKANGLTATLEEDGSVSMKDASGHSVLTIPAPFMYDADGEYSQDVAFSLSEGNGNGKYELTVTADKEWINSASLPVTIDPYIQPESNTQSFATSWYTQASPNSHTETYSFVAGRREGTRNRGYLKILSLPTLSSSDVVTDATLVMCQGGSIFPTDTDSKAAFVYMATNRSSTYPTWDSQPMESEALDYNKRTIDNDTYITYNITRAVKKWYKDPESNFGLIFVGSNENASSDAFIRYWSEDNGGVAYRPKLYVSYLNCKGLEDYQSYHTSSAGSAGTGYVNDFSGALTFVHTDFVGSGSRMPISISHVYNSTDVGEDRYYTQFYTAEMKSGNGWKLNIQEKIRNITNAPEDAIEDSNATYVHTDADGTEHYFILKEGQSATGNPRSYICETNPDLTLTRQKTNDVVTFTMTNDKTHYSKVFDKDGYITKCTDNNGNSITYYYAQYNTVKNGETVTYKYITSISDGAGRVYSFNYDSSHRVTSITDPSGKSITYTYDSASGNLTTVTYPWNTTSTFEYNSNGMLIKATDSERNYSIEYTYGTGADSRKVLQVTEKGGSQTGITLGITYNDNATTEFRTAGSDDIYGNGDDMLTVYGFDYLGRCVVCYATGTDKDRIYGVSSATFQNSNKVSTGNKLTESATIGMYSENLLNDPNFEDSSKGCYESNATVTVDTTEHYLGEKSRKIVISEAKPDVAGFVLYSIANTSGKHTFSVYVKLSSITAAPNAEESGLAINITAPDNAITEKVFPFESSAEYIGKWQRIDMTADFSRGGLVIIKCGLKNASGTLFADMAQFEKGECATYPNPIKDGDCREYVSDVWTFSDDTLVTFATNSEPYIGQCLRMDGDFLTDLYAEQTVVVNDNVSDTFILSGWGKATSAQTLTSEQEQETSNHNIVNKTGTRFMLKATVKYEDKNISTGSARTNRTYTVEIPFNEQYTGWQFVSKPIIIKPDNGYEVTKINTVTVAAVYSKNLNTAYFDKISLVRDVACSYTYDKNGNVISTQALKEQKSNLEYSPSNELTKQTNPSGYDYTYTYYSNHNLA